MKIKLTLAGGTSVEGSVQAADADALMRDMAEGASRFGWMAVSDNGSTKFVHLTQVASLEIVPTPPPAA